MIEKCVTLCQSSMLMLFPFLYIFFKNGKNKWENLIGFLLFFIIIFSQLFWSCPINKCIIHRIDAFIAKITIGISFIYFTFYKKKGNNQIYFIIFCVLGMTISFYLSDVSSSNEWLSISHIFYHSFVHIFATVSMFYVLL